MKIKALPLFTCVALFSIFILLTPHFGFGSTVLKILALTPLFFTICLVTCIVDEYGSNQSLHILVWGFAASMGVGLMHMASDVLLPDLAMRFTNFICAAGAAYSISLAATVSFEKFRKRLPSSANTALIASASAVPGLFFSNSLVMMSIICALWMLLTAFAITRPAPALVKRRLRSAA